jgi:hypothetical protein
MSFAIVGSSLNSSTTAKVLQRQNFNKEPNGLETIIESYAISTANRDTIIPEKNTLHSAFSSSTKKYTRMVVESVTTEEQDGGITQMLVTYVGLTSSTGLPPAIVRLIPTEGAGIYGPPLTIEAEFVTDVSESEFINGSIIKNTQLAVPPSLASALGLNQNINKMPAFINGTKMPDNPRQPFVRSGGFGVDQYLGYITQTFSCERRGLFLIARTTYVEARTGFRVV